MAGSCIVAIEVEKASRQAPEPAVSQTGIGFLFDEAEPIEVICGRRFASRRDRAGGW